jgi:hypothetical protein
MHCSVVVVFLDYIYALFRWCGIFLLHLSTFPTLWYFLLHLYTVPTVWYFLITFIHCSDGVVFFDYIYALFRRFGIFLITFIHCSDSVVFFFITFMHCSDGVVFFVFHFFRPQYQTHSYTLGLHA